jgi:hypothetical protein
MVFSLILLVTHYSITPFFLLLMPTIPIFQQSIIPWGQQKSIMMEITIDEYPKNQGLLHGMSRLSFDKTFQMG